MTRRNLILITVDSLRHDFYKLKNLFGIDTPYLDSLLREGSYFDQAISNGPNTPSSFPAIHTSYYASMCPMKTITEIVSSQAPCLIGRTTIAEVLQREGYITAAFHANPFLSTFYGYDRGFMHFNYEGWASTFHGKAMDAWLPLRDSLLQKLRIKKKSIAGRILDAVRITLRTNERQKTNLYRKLGQFLEGVKSPFFLWVHDMDIHFPYHPNGGSLWEFLHARHLNQRMLRAPNNLTAVDIFGLRRLYISGLKRIDQNVGMLLKRLTKVGHSFHDTFVIFTSDHGEELHEHGGFLHGSPTGEGKLYDELIRVPLLICGPGIERRSIERQVELRSIPKTICELLEIDAVGHFNGKSLFDKHGQSAVISEYLTTQKQGYSVRTSRYKYIRIVHRREVRHELYDLRKDSEENRNLWQQQNKLADNLVRMIESHIKTNAMDTKKETTVYETGEEEKIKDRLRRLGYL